MIKRFYWQGTYIPRRQFWVAINEPLAVLNFEPVKEIVLALRKKHLRLVNDGVIGLTTEQFDSSELSVAQKIATHACLRSILRGASVRGSLVQAQPLIPILYTYFCRPRCSQTTTGPVADRSSGENCLAVIGGTVPP